MPANSESDLFSILEALGQPALVTGADLRVLAASEEARMIAPGLRLGAGLAMGIRAPEMLEAARRIAAGGAPENIVWSEPVPAGRLFDVRLARLSLGAAPCILIVLRDLSESRRIERMRTDFVANASHELRTPLASMLGFVETLQGPAKDDAVARERFLNVMAEQGRRMARLINDLLSLSRIEQNLHVRPQTEVEMTSVIQHVVDTLRPMAAENFARLHLDLPPEAYVLGDRDELVRVIENLIENAIKYSGGSSDHPSRVDVLLHDDGGRWMFVVRDDGPGIAAEHLPRLTERFYRVDAQASRTKGGTGLGLAIVKHIVARHRGQFFIESKVGAGSSFKIALEKSR